LRGALDGQAFRVDPSQMPVPRTGTHAACGISNMQVDSAYTVLHTT
jgi:hypothetical protein